MAVLTLPFDRYAFLNVFAAYNQTFPAVVVVLWVLTAAAFVSFVRGTRTHVLIAASVLATLWAWGGLGYHIAFFTAINPAAWAFGALFVVEAALLTLEGIVRGRLRFDARGPWRRAVAFGLIAYGLIYPLVAWMDGEPYPRLPTFGVPCPTAIVTIGFLLSTAPARHRWLKAIPIGWAFISGSAALQLGIHADFVLFAAGIVLAGDVASSVIPQSRRAPSPGLRHP